MRAVVLVLLAVAVAGCAGMRPGTTPNNNRQIKPGPGLLTGPTGEFWIYRRTTPVGESGKGADTAQPAPAPDGS